MLLTFALVGYQSVSKEVDSTSSKTGASNWIKISYRSLNLLTPKEYRSIFLNNKDPAMS